MYCPVVWCTIEYRGDGMEQDKTLDERFAERLAQLRMAKGVSARDMSLSIGQSAGYINNIETKKNLPSMTGFFYICEYLSITPQEFFDFDMQSPQQLDELMGYLKKLDSKQIEHLTEFVKGLVK